MCADVVVVQIRMKCSATILLMKNLTGIIELLMGHDSYMPDGRLVPK